MKHIGKKLLTSVLLVTLILLAVSGCSQQMDTLDVEKEYDEAVTNSFAAELYYYKESVNKNFLEVNVLASRDENYQPIREGDIYEDLRLKVYEKRNNVSYSELLCGKSVSEADRATEQDHMFMVYWDEAGDQIVKREKQQITPEAYYQSSAFQPYWLVTKLAELQELKFSDMDFDIAKAEQEKNGVITNLTFGVKPEYLARYEAEHGKPSQFAGSSRVSLEIAYNKISHVSIYQTEEIFGVDFDNEVYNFSVVYLGKKFDIPSYDSGDWKDAPEPSLPIAS